MNQPLPQSFKEILEPVKQFVDHDPTPKKVLIDRVAGKVDYHVLNFLKMFSFIEIRKLDNDELIVV